MTEHIRLGDITGYDDAEIIDDESEVQDNENEQHDI